MLNLWCFCPPRGTLCWKGSATGRLALSTAEEPGILFRFGRSEYGLFSQSHESTVPLFPMAREVVRRRQPKILLELMVGFALVVTGATLASAQGVVFLVSSSSRTLRPEGFTETVGPVVLVAQSSGVIAADSILTFDYQTLIEPTSGIIGNGCRGGAFAKTVSGSVVTLRATAAVSCTAGRTISLAGVRVNANFLGAGAEVHVAVSGFVPASSSATNPLTFLQLTEPTVATVAASASTVTFTGRLLLLAAPTLAVVSADNAKFTFHETFKQALLSRRDEQDLNDNGAVEDFKIRFAFRDVPIGLRIDLVSTMGSSPTLATLASSRLPFLSTAGSQDVNVDITIDSDGSGTDTSGSPETLVVEFLLWVPDVTAFVPTNPAGSLRVELQGAESLPGVPRFTSEPLFLFPGPETSFPQPEIPKPQEFTVTDAASPASFTQGILAPGMLANATAAFGTSFQTGLTQTFFAPSLPLPPTLGGVTVRLGGSLALASGSGWQYSPLGSIEAPLVFAGPSRVLFQIPPGIGLGDAVPIQLQRPDGTGLLSTVRLVAAIPRIFTISMTGRGQAAVLNQDNSRNGNPESIPGAKPAAPGTAVRIFATGAGDTDPPLLPGEAAPASGDPLVLTRVKPEVTIGGVAATVLHSVMAPGFPGTWQIDVEVPASVSPGLATPLTINAAGFSSNPVTIAVE